MSWLIPDAVVRWTAKQAAKANGMPVDDALINDAIRRWRAKGSKLDAKTFN